MAKKILFLLAVFIIAVSACGYLKNNIEVSSSSRLFGLVGPKTSTTITDGTQFYIRLFALGEEVARMRPGSTVYDSRGFVLEYAPLPLIALAYLDESYTQYIGAAGYVMSINAGQQAKWTIREGEVQRPDGGHVNTAQSGYPIQDLGDAAQAVFPRIMVLSTTVVHFLNNTLFQANVRRVWYKGIRKVTLEPKEIYCEFFENMGDISIPVSINVEFSDRGKFLGHYETNFSIGHSPQAVQQILGFYQIQH